MRVNELDLLRFAAAMAVVVFHYAFRGYAADGRSVMPYPLLEPVAKYGFMGVELFFLISGFVILMTASRGTLRGFFVSRVVRLYPAFWACCTLTYIAIVLLGGSRYSASLPQYLANMTMLSGFAGVPSIDGVYWSLFVELQFYGLVAALLAIGRIHQAELFLGLWLAATLLLQRFPIEPLRFLLLTGYAAYFIAGATCFLVWTRGVTGYRLGVVACCLLLALYQALDGLPAFEAYYDTRMSRPVVGAMVVAFFGVMLLVALRRTAWLGRRRWLLAGALTYPLYLIHQNIGFMVFNAAYPAVNRHVLFVATVLLVLAISYGVHVLVERRCSAGLKRFTEGVWDGVADRLAGLRTRIRRGAPPALP